MAALTGGWEGRRAAEMLKRTCSHALDRIYIFTLHQYCRNERTENHVPGRQSYRVRKPRICEHISASQHVQVLDAHADGIRLDTTQTADIKTEIVQQITPHIV